MNNAKQAPGPSEEMTPSVLVPSGGTSIPKSEEKEDTSSNESSSGKESGSGGSGGYNADCSASDQSSEGDRKTLKSFPSLNAASVANSSAKRLSESSRGSKKLRKGAKSTGVRTRTIDRLLDIETYLSRNIGDHDDDGDDDDSQTLDSGDFLPQLHGIRIKHPMDPRIDISRVGQTSSNPVPLPAPLRNKSQGIEQEQKTADEVNGTTSIPSLESYMQLLQVVRPFFQAQGVPLQTRPVQASGASSSQADSSEGFTSFFTTTHTGSNTTTNSGSPNSSDFDKKDACSTTNSRGSTGKDHSKASSLRVLAPTRTSDRPTAESACDSPSSGEKRVRIREAANQEHESAQILQKPPGESASSSDHVVRDEMRDSASSSSSDQRRHPQHQQNDIGNAVPRRVVTDVSSSNRTDSGISSGVSNRNTSGSGSATNTGSGSNQGSSGSGNEKGSSEEQRGDSADGANPSNDTTQTKKELSQAHSEGKEGSVRERKLLDKKRKRIEMRREYEAQQSSSSESRQYQEDIYLKPGRPTTLDQLMMVSKIPRILVQAIPPFRVIHTNAAYSHLTGNDAHYVSKKPVSSLISILEFHTKPKPTAIASGEDEALVQAAAAGRAKAEATVPIKSTTSVGLERLVDTNSFGKIHFVNVSANPNNVMVGRNVSFVTAEVSPMTRKCEQKGQRDESSNDTSLTNSAGENHPFLSCKATIAPVVSAPEMIDCPKEQASDTSKRRKKEDGAKPNAAPIEDVGLPKKSMPYLVTHYAIQLQLHEGVSINHESNDSLTSNPNSAEFTGQKASIAVG